ncbi:unnamed protein product [Macrosiphum euphorbiae]|nr:unnamed protein product [Macrosiphum euphorbiae]
MGQRPTAGFSEINLDNLDSLDTTSQISNKDGCKVSDYAKHHVIPFATIKEFVNLVLRDPLVQIEGCRVIKNVGNKLKSIDIRNQLTQKDNSFLRLTQGEDIINQPTEKETFFVRLMLSKNEKGLKDIINNSQNPKVLTEHIQQFVTWFPGNIFIGPRPDKRGDDPGNDFEELAKYIIGEDRHNTLRLIHIKMVKCIDKFKLSSTKNVDYTLANEVLELFSKQSQYPVTQFYLNDWQEKWFIKINLKRNPKNKPVPDPSIKPRCVVSHYYRHNIIPWATIIDFFYLVIRDSLTPIGTRSRVIEEVKNKLASENTVKAINQPTEKDNFIVKLIQSKNEKGLQEVIKKSPSPEVVMNHIQQFVTWLPGNIFIGPEPNIRGDHPGNDFEKLAGYIISEAHHNLLKDMNTEMVNYINTFTSKNKRYSIVNKVLELFSKLLSYQVTQYDPDNWLSKWFIKKEY